MMLLVQIINFYINYSILYDKTIENYNKISDQVEQTINKSLEDIENATAMVAGGHSVQYYLTLESSKEAYDYFNFPLDNMRYVTWANSDIQSMMLYSDNVRLLENEYNNIQVDIFYNMDKDYGYTQEVLTESFYTRCYVDNTRSAVYFGYIYPILSLEAEEFLPKRAGVLVSICQNSNITKYLNNLQYDESILIITDGQTMIGSNKKEIAKNFLANNMLSALNTNNNNEIIEISNEKYMVNVSEFTRIGWKSISLVPRKALVKAASKSAVINSVVLFISLIIILFFGIEIINSINGQVKYILNKMVKIGEEDSKYRIKVCFNNEIGLIASNMNIMLDKIENMTKKIFQSQRNLHEMEIINMNTELAFFHSQINPHFLYNSLECIRSMAEYYDVPDIATISNAMAKIFRYSIKGEKTVTIGIEIDCIKEYMNVMNLRYMNKYRLKIHVPEKIKKCYMEKMILQPIVENCIKHGLEGKKNIGYLLVKAKSVDNDSIIIDIVDNGRGMSAGQVKNLNALLKGVENKERSSEEKKIGLYNINKRIKLNYGEKYGLSVFSKENYYTKISILIPKNTTKSINERAALS
jgi:two-component system sensor histidine kinase YesM